MKRAIASLLALSLVVALPAATMAARKHPHAPLAVASVSVSPDPIQVGVEFTVTVTTDTAGWLHEQTPCVDGWVNVATGTSAVTFAAPCEAGTVTLELTDIDGLTYAGPFTYEAQ